MLQGVEKEKGWSLQRVKPDRMHELTSRGGEMDIPIGSNEQVVHYLEPIPTELHEVSEEYVCVEVKDLRRN